MLRLLFLPMAVLLPLLASAPVRAIGMGEIEVSSHLGEPLRARVPISIDEEILPGTECVRLVGPATRHPDLAGVRIELVGSGRQRQVNIRTSQPVDDPMLDLSLRAEGCGPTLRKDFVVMLSPRQMVAPEVAPPPAAVQPPPPPAVRSAPARPAADEVAKARSAKPAGTSRKAKRTKTVKAARPTTAPRFVFRLDYDDTAFGRLAESIAQKKQAEYRAGNRQGGPGLVAKVEPASPRPAAGDSVPVDAATGTAQAPMDRLVLQAAPPDIEPGGDGGEPGGPAEGETGGAGAPGAEKPAAAPDGAMPAIATPEAQGKDSGAWYAWFLESYNLILLLLLLLLAGLVALWLVRRRPQSRFMDKSATDLTVLLHKDVEEAQEDPFLIRKPAPAAVPEPPEVEPGPAPAQPAEPSPAAPPEAVRTQPEPQAAPDAETEAALAGVLETRPRNQVTSAFEFDADVAAKPIKAEEFSLDQKESLDHVMELAEVMLAFGRSSQAIDALSQHIRANPRQAVDPWLKLLDLYHQSGLRNEFESLAAELHTHFNIAIVEWDDYAGTSGLPREEGPLSLESLSHIMARVTELWNSREGLEYLDKLLEDNRGGQRLGFSILIVRDILLLRDILRQTCQVAA